MNIEENGAREMQRQDLMEVALILDEIAPQSIEEPAPTPDHAARRLALKREALRLLHELATEPPTPIVRTEPPAS